MNESELESVLRSIGMSCFVDHFHDFANDSLSNQDVIERLPDNYTAKSRASRTSTARRIIRENSERAALTLVANSTRVNPSAAAKARVILAGLG